MTKDNAGLTGVAREAAPTSPGLSAPEGGEEKSLEVGVGRGPASVALSEKDASKRPSLVDYLLAGEPWPDDIVDAINHRPRGRDRNIVF